MKTEVTKAYNGEIEKYIDWKKYANEPNILVQIFCGEGGKALQDYAKKIIKKIPHAHILGSTTDGEIVCQEVTSKKTAIAISVFRHTTLKSGYVSSGDSFENGKKLTNNLVSSDTKLMILFSDGTTSNGEMIIKGIESVKPKLLIAGGMAGDNATFTQTYILHGTTLLKEGVVGITLNSKLLEVKNFFYFDWLPIDRKFKVTKAKNNRVYTIDNVPAVELYRIYFGEKTASRLPKVGIDFPLMVTRGSMLVARAVLDKKEDGSLILAGNIYEGEDVRFGFGNSIGIAKNISNALEPIGDMQGQTFFIYTCMARKKFISHDISPEISPYASNAPTAGFFTYGEFYHLEDRNELLNETITGVALSEPGDETTVPMKCDISAHTIMNNTLETFEALSHILEKNSEDLDMLFKLFEQSHIVLFQWRNDEKRTIKYVSPNVVDLTGYESNKFISKEVNYFDLIYEDDRSRIERDIAIALENNLDEISHEPYRIIDYNGNIVWVEDHSRVMRNRDGKALFIAGYLTDVTSKVHNEQRLMMHASIFENALEAIMITDKDNKIVSVNPAFEKITGYKESEVLGKNPSLLKSGYHDDLFYKRMWSILKKRGEWQGEVHDVDRDGNIYIVWLSIKVIYDIKGNISNYIAMQTDITDIYRTKERLSQLAHYDILTQLPNRLYFQEYVKHAIDRSKHNNSMFALLYLDLDNFKTVNDSLGHTIGDGLIQEVAKRLKKTIRDSDTISRQGGDEFLVLIEDITDKDIVKKVAQKILDEISKPYNIANHILHTTFSIGIAFYPDDGTNFQELLQYSDLAMYEAKKSGRNRYHLFSNSMLADIKSKHEIQTQLRYAMENGELSLHYQPQIKCNTEDIRGFEALLRWRSSVLGDVSPGQYIAAAEENGMIVDIGKWVLEEVCKQIKEFKYRYKIAANISALQFEDIHFVEYVENLIGKYSIPPYKLELELTESILMSNINRSIQIMQRLKRLGILISIDDFGTGYSSLSYLKQFPADSLKIDRSFIQDLEFNEDAKSIVDAIIHIGHIFGMNVIAEGVESVEQAQFLKDNNFDDIQGYFYGYPMPFNELESYIADYSSKCI